MYNKRNYGVAGNIGSFLEDAFQNGISRFNEEVNSSIPVNILETDKSYELLVVAPGLKKEDFKVNVDRNLLHISYDHKEESKEQVEGTKLLRNEYRIRSFKRTFTLNEKIDAGNINAKYTDGILYITLSKKENTTPPAQEIPVN